MNVITYSIRFSLANVSKFAVRAFSSEAKASPMALSTKKNAAKRIVWIDLEMTGLDIEKDYILEVACVVTDEELNVLASGPDIIIHQPDSILNNMNDWCIAQHGLCFVKQFDGVGVLFVEWVPPPCLYLPPNSGACTTVFCVDGKSGLTEACRKSKVTLKQAERQILDFVKSHAPEKKCPLGGNSVYIDRLFLRKYMPTLNDYLHYRIVDVSTIKELAKRWFQREYSFLPTKKFTHRSLNDILESIQELKYYRENIFKRQ